MGRAPEWKAVREVITEVTDKPWFSWPAHVDYRTGYVYWGSDFIIEARKGPKAVRDALEDYIENRMRERTW